jgi:cytochrome P450
MKPLREEVEEVIQREGWTKDALDKMPKLDSFIKESQRLHPISIRKPMPYISYSPKLNAVSVGMPRKVLNGYTFTDGTKVPRGSTVAVALESVHLNDTIYPDALTFDPLRFVKLKEQDATARKFDIVNTSMESLAFGHGKHACPGRFFAASLLKAMFAHVVINYDVKLENEGVRPKDLWLVTACTPNRNAKIFFRKRVL